MNASQHDDEAMAAETFNYTFTLGSLFDLPSRIVARLRKLDDGFTSQQSANSLGPSTAVDGGPMRRLHAETTFQHDAVSLPGPLAFVTSGYAVGLLLMALLLNRIQHIVAPPRRSLAYRVIRSRRSLYHAIYYSIFPIDLSSTACRLSLRLPSLYLLFKSLALLSVILLQVAGLYPTWQVKWIQTVSAWADSQDMSAVCWQTFSAACAALGVTALTRGLEGSTLSNTSPFNLFGYAFLLHIYANPLTHSYNGTPSRPDSHILITIILPLLQLTFLHFLEIRRDWARQRLIPTTICSMLTLIHFHFVLITTPSSYPLLNYLSCVLESLLLLVTLITIGLNALTQVLLTGEVTRPLFGHAQTLAPKWDEDFAVALLRLGTASLEATSVAGLGNEVGPVNVAEIYKSKRVVTSTAPLTEDVIELRRLETVHVMANQLTRGRPQKTGFSNEIKHVKAKSTEGDWWLDKAWLMEWKKFLMSFWSVLKGFWKLFTWMIWYRWRQEHVINEGVTSALRTGDEARVRQLSSRRLASEDEALLYQRFLSGETLSDDDDEYDIPASTATSASESSANSVLPSDAEDNAGDDESRRTEALNLYTDLMEEEIGTSSPVLLAHMTTPTTVTRRKYASLIAGHPHSLVDGSDALSQFAAERRAGVGSSSDASTILNRTCVICTVEQREVICWPCRCLALCDDCRANLASRQAASKHTCPCCRRTVEGYSRIYIP